MYHMTFTLHCYISAFNLTAALMATRIFFLFPFPTKEMLNCSGSDEQSYPGTSELNVPDRSSEALEDLYRPFRGTGCLDVPLEGPSPW